MAVDTNNIHVEEFIKENRVDDVTTSLTIKLVAYDLDDLVEFIEKAQDALVEIAMQNEHYENHSNSRSSSRQEV